MCHSFGATELQVDSQEIENKSAQELPAGWVSLCPSTSFLFLVIFLLCHIVYLKCLANSHYMFSWPVHSTPVQGVPSTDNNFLFVFTLVYRIRE
jgi:hypothetical protein